jgi:hypothetical protein
MYVNNITKLKYANGLSDIRMISHNKEDWFDVLFTPSDDFFRTNAGKQFRVCII